MADNDSTVNLVGLWQVIERHAAKIIWLVVASLIICTLVLFFGPKYYKSTAVVLAANPLLTDKAHIFNENVDQLYSGFGVSDDIDRLFGYASLDTTFALLVDTFDLIHYYKTTNKTPGVNRSNAVLALRKDVKLQRNEFYQLTITTWNKNPQLAANITNTLVNVIQNMVQHVWKNSYESTLLQLNASIATLTKRFEAINDSVALDNGRRGIFELAIAEKNTLLNQINDNRKAALQIQLTLSNNTPALVVVEKGAIAPLPDKPKKVLVLLATFFASVVFGVIAALVYDKRSN